MKRSLLAALFSGLAAIAAGCDSPEPQFHLNVLYGAHESDEGAPFTDQHAQDVADVMAAMFGTPNEPKLPQLEEADIEQLVDLEKLETAAGPVSSDRLGRGRGLYREHCAHCHGVTGDGRGPTAPFLNPYPRDYRMGKFKFKSTPLGYKPTHEDLYHILSEGIPGTAMPSFKLLAEDELESLVQYVIYLSIRGEVERNLIREAVMLDEGDRLVDLSLRETDVQAFDDQLSYIEEIASRVVGRWVQSESEVTQPTDPPENYGSPESLARGRELFYGTVANCVKCHGPSALGDGQTTDNDDWTKELEPDNPEALEEYLALGALEPRNIEPRNLRRGVFRGGNRPIDIYWRLHNGIEGTPMPAVTKKPPGAGPETPGLTDDDLWHLVAYVRNLQYEPLSKPQGLMPENRRERL